MIAVARDQPANVEFARGVKAAVILGQRLAQQPISADDGRPVAGRAVARGVVEHQEVVADRVIAIDVAAREQPAGIGDGRTFLVENPVAQFLRLADFGGGLRQPDFERADAAEALRRAMRARGPGLQSAIGLQRRNQAGYGRRGAKALQQVTRRVQASVAGHLIIGPFPRPNRANG